MPTRISSTSFVAEQLLKPRQEIGERLRRNILQRLGDHLQLVADGDADPLGPVVNGENAHVLSMSSITAAGSSGYNVFITFAAACTVFSMSAAVCAVERKPASNCDGAR